MSEITAQKVRVQCHACGARFKSAARNAGKRGPCPKCGTVLMIPGQEVPAEVGGDVDWSMLAGAVKPPSAAGMGGEDELADYRREVPLAPLDDEPDPVLMSAAQAPPATPSLGALSEPARQKIAERVAERMKKSYQRFDEEEPGGNLAVGIVAAIFCGIIAAGMWFALFALSSRELRFLSVAVGVLAGAGMYLGYQRQSWTAGYLAAGAAMLGLIGAKVAFVGFGERIKIANKPPVQLSKVEQQIEDEYRTPDPEATDAAVRQWIAKDYLFEHNLEPKHLIPDEYARVRHDWKIIDIHAALTPEEAFERAYRWTLFADKLSDRQREAEIAWEAQQQAKAAEAVLQDSGDEASEASDSSAEPGAAEQGEAAAGAAQDKPAPMRFEPTDDDLELDEYGWSDEPGLRAKPTWSEEKRAAMEPLLKQVERDFFYQVKELPLDIVRKYRDDKREALRRARKIAAKRAGEDIREAFVELGEDPVAIAAAQAEADKYKPITPIDLAMLPFALAAALFIGRGWN